MKKTLAILLSLALLITAIPFATASANTYTTATDFCTLSNWVGPSSSNAGADGSTYIEMGYLRGAERTFAMTLKENTIYTLSFKVTANWGTNGQDKLYFDGGIKVLDASGTDIVTSKSGDDAWLAYGASSVVTLQFTTGTDTAYTLYMKGGWWNNNAALGGKFTEFALSEVPQTPTYTTATDFYTLSNWVGPSSSNAGADGSTYIEMGYLRGAERTFAMTLKENTTYTLSFKVTANWGTDGTDKLYFDGGIKVLDASGTDIVTSKSGDDAWLAYGASSVVTLQFTTGTDTAYTLYMKGGWWNNNAALGGKFTEFALNEYVEPTDLENATEAISGKFTGTNYGSIRAKSGDKAQGLRVKSTLDLSVLGEGALENCTVVEYGTLVTKKASLNGAELTIDLLDDIKMIKGVAYDQNGTDIVYELTDTTKSFTLVLINIPVERFITAYTYRAYAIIEDAEGNQTTVYGGAGTEVSVESVATDIVNSGTASADDLAAAEAALAELEEYEATLPTYTTAEDLADAANWVAGGDTTLTQLEGGVQMQAWYTVYASLFTTLNLKAHTTYTITASFEGDCYTTLLTDANGVAVVPASVYSTETASGAAWPVSLIEANNIGSGYTHNNLNSGTMTVTFTTTDETQYTLGVRDSGRGSAVTWACNPLVKFTNFAITEVAQ